MTRNGLFLAFEGGEGTGKGTQIARLVARLKAEGCDVVHTREPGGSREAEAIRDLLVTGDAGRWSADEELLLFTAARANHLRTVILPAIARGAVVVCDRFVGSTLCYQGVARGVPSEKILALHKEFCHGLFPDLTFVLELDPEIGLARAGARNGSSAAAEDRFEKNGLAFHRRVREAFLAMAKAAPERHAVIDADGTPEEVAARIDVALDRFLQEVRR